MPAAKATTTKNLYAKLAEITGKLAHIEKKGFNKAQNYRFAREADVAAEASKLFAEYNIALIQSVRSHKMEPLYQTSRNATMYLCEVVMGFQFIDGDDPQQKTDVLEFVGHGADTGDKGIYKAMTGAEKYFLMKTFLISTGDDPEADEKVDKAVAASGAARGGRRVTKSDQSGVQRGGKTNEATEAQVNEIARLVKEKRIDPSTTLVEIVTSTTGKPAPEEEMSVRDWLSSFSAKELAAIITNLLPYAEPDEAGPEAGGYPVETSGDPDDENGEDGEQGELAIV